MTPIIPLIPDEIENLQNKFIESHRLSDFLAVLSCLAVRKVEYHPIWTVWRKHKDLVSSDSHLNEVLEWCAQFVIADHLALEITPSTSSDKRINHTGLFQEKIDAIKNSASLSVEATKLFESYFETKLQDPDNPYGKAAAAWDLQPVLEKSFGKEDDPARYIARFIRTLFSGVEIREEAQSKPAIVNLSVLRFVQQELPVWALNAERALCANKANSQNIEISVTAACRSGQLQALEGQLQGILELLMSPRQQQFPLHGIVKVLPYLPQQAFERICASLCDIYSSIHANDKGADENAFGLFIDIVTALPLGKGYGHRDWEEEQIPSQCYLNDIIQNIYPISSLPFLPMAQLGGVLYALAQRFDVIPFEFDADAIETKGYITVTVLRERIIGLVSRFTVIRRDQYGGKAPLHEETLESIDYWLNEVSEGLLIKPEFDASMKLAVTSEKALFAFYWLSYVDESDKQQAHKGKARAIDFIETYQSICREGWYELANASLALFLVSQAIYFNGRLYVDWSVFGDLMVRSRELPRSGQVAIASAIAYQYSLVSG